MYKNASYKEKFSALQEWIPFLVEAVKKDLRQEHLKKDVYFVKKFLASKNIHKVTTDELAQAYQQAIQESEKGEELAEFITSRWLLKNSELYDFFEQQLSQISPDFAAIEELDQSQAQTLIEASTSQFGAAPTYLFSVLNSVVFPPESFQSLKTKAQQHRQRQEEERTQAAEESTVATSRQEFEREIARLTDRYEKKLAGLQKKYLADVEGLKKQVAHLQRTLQNRKSA